MELELELGTARSAGVHVRVGAGERTVIGYDAGAGCVFLDRSHAGASAFGEGFSARHRAPYTLIDGLVRLTELVDSASVEVFAGDVALFAEGGTATVRRLRTWAVQASRVSPAG
jgi:fructan beta-fructosidase